MRLTTFAVWLLCCLPAAAAAPSAGQIEGEWDMSKKVRRYAVFIELREPGNPHPGLFAGGSESGTLAIKVHKHLVTEEMTIRSEGGFVARMTAAPRKHGMEPKIPGGLWADDLKARNFSVELMEFGNWRIDEGQAKSPGGFRLTADCAGKLSVDGRAAPFRAAAAFEFSGAAAAWSCVAKGTVTGADLGLQGSQAGKLDLTVHVKSPTIKQQAELPEVELPKE